MASKRRWMEAPKNRTAIDTNGSGTSAINVRRASRPNISTRATTKTMIVLAEYITAGPAIMRTAFRSFVALDIRSPVRARLEVGRRKGLQPREEVVAQVVLEVARHADDDAAHQKAEAAPDERESRG